ISRTVQTYIAFLACFMILCAVHVNFRGAESSVLEYALRFWAGLLNGYFFWKLAEGRRSTLFGIIVAIAAGHALASLTVATLQSVDFSTMTIEPGRAGGTNNPVPYSLML